jgi:hypothetical protein
MSGVQSDPSGAPQFEAVRRAKVTTLASANVLNDVNVQPEPKLFPPSLERVPFVPKTAGEEAIPTFSPPGAPEMEPVTFSDLSLPPQPAFPAEPLALPEEQAAHGADWSGLLPAVEELPQFMVPVLEEMPDVVLPVAPGAPATQVRCRSCSGPRHIHKCFCV